SSRRSSVRFRRCSSSPSRPIGTRTNESEFRYVLQPGEGINCAHNIPIGQVCFVPREEIPMRDCTQEELTAIKQSKEEFFKEKAASKQTTGFGLQFSPHYQRQSRAQHP